MNLLPQLAAFASSAVLMLATAFPASTAAAGTYSEALRPQFHFTAPAGWLNDPNGLVFYQGEFHLFYQHNPAGTNWVNDLSWGHAISRDLLHWEHLPVTIAPTPIPAKDEERPRMAGSWSGTGVVDWNNSAGFQRGTEKAIVVAWTATGLGQCLAYSNDRGRTFRKYEGNPVLPIPATQKGDWDRDPKLLWHAPTKKWIMVLSITGKGFDFYSSPNLKKWTYLSTIPGLWECPELFELPVEDASEQRFRAKPARETRPSPPAQRKWVLWDASTKYFIGSFNGTNFHPESGPHLLDTGRNYYAAQTWSDVPESDGRRIALGWMRDGKYPGMPFNQQMSIPSVLKLRLLPEGTRLTKLPVKELEQLRSDTRHWDTATYRPGTNLFQGVSGETFDLKGEFEPGEGTAIQLNVRGTTVLWATNVLSCLGKTTTLNPVNGRIKLRLLVDRTSIEIFGNDGARSMSFCFLPPAENTNLALQFVGGSAKVTMLDLHRIRSVWKSSGR